MNNITEMLQICQILVNLHKTIAKTVKFCYNYM